MDSMYTVPDTVLIELLCGLLSHSSLIASTSRFYTGLNSPISLYRFERLKLLGN